MISVIIPAYNSQDTIEQTVNSVLLQTGPEREVIVVNDGSRDDTSSIVERISARDSRVRLLNQENWGAYAARLAGIRQAQGEWISFLDSDDTLTPDALSKLSENINEEIDIVVGTLNLNNRRIFEHQVDGIISAEEYIKAVLLSQTSVGMCAKLFKRELFNHAGLEQSDRFEQNEDLLMLIRVSLNASKVMIAGKAVVYNYIFRQTGASRRATGLEKWFKLFEQLNDILKENEAFKRAVFTYKVNTLYTQGVYKLGDFSSVSEQLADLLREADNYELTKQETHQLKYIKSPVLRKIRGSLWLMELNTKNRIKKVLGYEE